MTTIMYGAEIDLDIRHFKNKLEITTDPVERARLERQITVLEDAVVIYRLPTRQEQEVRNGIGSSGL